MYELSPFDDVRSQTMTCLTIYADYQATTPVDARVLKAMEPHWNVRFGNPHSSEHVVGWRAAESVRSAARDSGRLNWWRPRRDRIFTSGATEANNLAIIGLARKADAATATHLGQCHRTQMCHRIRQLSSRSRRDSSSRQYQSDKFGFVDLDQLERNG